MFIASLRSPTKYPTSYLIFVGVKTPCKISDPKDNPFRENSKKGEEREKYANTRGYYVLPAMPKGEAQGADQLMFLKYL